MQTRHLNALRTFLSTSLSLAALGLLGGCSASFTPSAIQSDKAYIGNIQGAVHGGQAPVSGGRIYVYAAGTVGYGTPATSLISSAGSNVFTDDGTTYYVKTDANGNFALSGDYSCTVGTQIYLVAVGGNPGLAAGTDNKAIVQMAGLGQCPSTGTMASVTPYVVINEVSTVAFAYAMSGFATTPYNVSSKAGVGTGDALSATAIANAMANVGNILNIGYGQVPAKTNAAGSNGTVPVSKIYTLANILASCVNTSSASSPQCLLLFANATSDGTSTGTTATNESEAIFNIVHHPMANVAALYALQPTTPAFTPNLSSAPNDWTLPIVYSGAAGVPFNIAFDTAGNAWIGDESKGIVKLTPQGSVSTYNFNFGLIKGLSVAPSGDIWAADYNNSKIYILSSAGSLTNTLTANGLNQPSSIAFNNSGQAWVANEGDASVSQFYASGNPYPPSGSYPLNNINSPAWIAVDTQDNAWVPSTKTAYLGEMPVGLKGNGNGNNKTKSYLVNYSYALAFDSSSNIWMGNADNTFSGVPALYEVSTSGSILQTITGGGLNIPYMVNVDGGGNIWIANEVSPIVSGYSSTSAKWLASNGFSTATGGTCYAATPDMSGNLWTGNSDGSVTQLLGLSVPTAAPLLPQNYGVKP